MKEDVQDYNLYYKKRGGYHWDLYYKNLDQLYVEHVNKVVDFFRDKSGMLLDIGCGDGLILHLLSKQTSLLCVGIDYSKKAIEIARSKGVKNCQNLDLNDIQTLQRNFQNIFLGDTLEHISDYEKALKNVELLLSETGILYFASPIRKAGLDFHNFTKEDCDNFLSKHFIIENFEKTERSFYYVCRKKL